ncbi:hypothetical protein [Cellulophaga sp. Z1A5H]|uniref:hypothetical protein n=1 Tax=Cellulophaga sp. Z1A5H TaxID=2687291 RepID=UPI0013FE1ECD|nr:hypothetical protein [Cellulophaga sp. Z1A5H]
MEVVYSFFSNIKDKFTNPFFGTLILVLLIHHWQLFFSVFNFDNDCTLNEKIIFLENYISENINLESFLLDILKSLAYMIFGYLIVLGTRALVLWVEFRLMPILTGRIVSKNVVRKIEYDDVVSEREQYFDQYEEQRENVRRFSRAIDEQTEQIRQKDQDFIAQNNLMNDRVKELGEIRSKLDASEKKYQLELLVRDKLEITDNKLKKKLEIVENQVKKLRDIFLDGRDQEYYTAVINFPPEILRVVSDLKRENLWLNFLEIGNYFEKGGIMIPDDVIKLANKGLMYKIGNSEGWTLLGEIIWKHRKVFR